MQSKNQHSPSAAKSGEVDGNIQEFSGKSHVWPSFCSTIGYGWEFGEFLPKKLGQKVKINMREAFGWGWSSSSSENKSPFPWCSWFSWQEVFKVKPHPEKAPWAVRTSKFLSGILPGASSLLCKAPSSRPTTKAEGSASNKKGIFPHKVLHPP